MELMLEIYKWTGRDGLCNYYNKGICELDYNGYRYKGNNEDDWNIEKFPIWDIIQIEFKNDIKIDDEEFYELRIVQRFFCVAKNEIHKLEEFCSMRNKEVLNKRKSVPRYIDNEILNIAENLLIIAEEDIMLNYRIITRLHQIYSCIESKIFKRGQNYGDANEDGSGGRYLLLKSTYGIKGREKKEAEEYNKKLDKSIRETTKLIYNFIEIIKDQKNINQYVAGAVAWQAIQIKIVEYYSEKWIEEYECNLEKTYDEIYSGAKVSDIDTVEVNYIKEVLLCNEIDILHAREILIYFLLSKRNIKELVY